MPHSNTKRAAQIAIGSLLVLLCGAIVFYQERMLLADAPWVIYNIINTKSFFIQQHRYGCFITQLFPVLCVFFHLPLKAILIIYSLSFNLFYLVAALIIFIRKQYVLVLLLACYHTLCVTDSYYWTNNEVHQGITWMCLMMCIMMDSNRVNAALHYAIFSLLAFLAIFSHPIVIIVVVFISIFLLITDKKFRNSRATVYYGLVISAIICTKYYFSLKGYYDGGKIDDLSSAKTKEFFNVFNTCTGQLFLKNCLIQYWQFSLITLCGFIFMLWQKYYAALVWCIVCFAIYFTCICIIYPNCDALFYIESEWMSITIIGILPLLLLVLPHVNAKIVSTLTIIVLSFRLFQIYNHAEKFTHRIFVINKMVRKVQQQNASKTIIIQTKEDDLNRQLLMTWGLPVETLILSNFNGPNKNSVTIAHLHKAEIPRYMRISGNHKFLNAFDTQHYSKLNPQYFWFDKTAPYKINESLKFIK